MTTIGNRFWVDWIYKCSYEGKGNNPCMSDCSDFETLGNLNYTGNNQTGAWYSNVSTVIFNSLDTVYNFSNWGSGTNYKNNSYLWGLFFESNQVDGSQANFIGNSNYAFPSGSNYVNAYFNGANIGISFALSSAYQTGNYAMMKANYLVDMSLVTSIDLSCSSSPLYQVNTNGCQSNQCDGVDLGENYSYVDTFTGVLTIKGIDILGQEVTFDTNVQFTQQDLIDGCKQFWMPTLLINIKECSFRLPNGIVLGDGYFTLRVNYKSGIRIAYDSFKTFTQGTFRTIASGGIGSVITAIDVINTLWGFISPPSACNDYVNLFTGHVSMCSRYAEISNGNVFDSSITWDVIEGMFSEGINALSPEELEYAVNIYEGITGEEGTLDPNKTYVEAINYIDFSKILYPKFSIQLNSGFDEPNDEDWCCESLDESSKKYVGGITTVEPEPVVIPPPEGEESGGGEGGESGGGSSGSDDDCVCEWLELIKSTLERKLTMINDSLLLIKSAIEGLTLECNTTVQPSTAQVQVSAPQVTVTPQITVEPCQPIVTNPVNNITVEPCSPVVTNPVNNVTVQPASPAVNNITVEPCSPVVNPTNLSGVISAIEGVTSQLQSGFNTDSDGLWCYDSSGSKKSIACILKDALTVNKCHGEAGLAQIVNQSLLIEKDKYGCDVESIAQIVDKSFNKHDECCDEDIHLIDTLTTSDDEGCDNVTITDVLKNKDMSNFTEVTVEPNELVNIRKVFYNNDEG